MCARCKRRERILGSCCSKREGRAGIIKLLGPHHTEHIEFYNLMKFHAWKPPIQKCRRSYCNPFRTWYFTLMAIFGAVFFNCIITNRQRPYTKKGDCKLCSMTEHRGGHIGSIWSIMHALCWWWTPKLEKFCKLHKTLDEGSSILVHSKCIACV